MDRVPMTFTSDVSLPKDNKKDMQGKQITAGQLTRLKTHRNANYAKKKKGRASKAWAVRQGKYTEIHLHLLRIIHLERSIQNIALVLICYEKMYVAWQCISERLWKCLVGRYGGCFEERYNKAYDDRAYHAKGLDASAKYVRTLEVRKGNARYQRG